MFARRHQVIGRRAAIKVLPLSAQHVLKGASVSFKRPAPSRISRVRMALPEASVVAGIHRFLDGEPR